MFTGYPFPTRLRKKHTSYFVILLTILILLVIGGLSHETIVTAVFRGCVNNTFEYGIYEGYQDDLEKCYKIAKVLGATLYGDHIVIDEVVELMDPSFSFVGYHEYLITSPFADCRLHPSSDHLNDSARCLVQTNDLSTVTQKSVPLSCVSAYNSLKDSFVVWDSFYQGGDLYVPETQGTCTTALYQPGSRFSFEWPGNPNQVSATDEVYRIAVEWRFSVDAQIYYDNSGPACFVLTSTKYVYRIDNSLDQHRFVFDPDGVLIAASFSYEDGDVLERVDNPSNLDTLDYYWDVPVPAPEVKITNAVFLDISD